MLKRLRFILAFVLGSAWFSLFQIWGAFPDPDAFYHAKISALMLDGGPLLSFPWLDLTVLHPGFNDQHLLFHYFLMPFVKWFGVLPGAQIAAVVAGGMFTVIVLWAVEKLAVRHAWFWTMVMVAMPPMITRLSLGKASPFAIGLFLLGMVAWKKSARHWAFIVGAVYALTHGGWLLLIGAQVVLAIGAWVYARFVEEKRTMPDFRIALATLGGGLLGTFIHPNFPENIPYLWVQIFQIGVATPTGRVVMGTEWYPYAPLELFVHLSLLMMIVCIAVLGFVRARRHQLDAVQASFAIGCGLLVAIFLALTFKSARFVEYLVPVLVLLLASLFQQIDETRLIASLRKFFRYLPHALLVAMIFIVGKGALATRWELRSSAKPFTRFEKSMDVVSSELKPGERLFHSDWAQFSLLWNRNDSIHYVAGLDPVFLLQSSSTLSDTYTALTLGTNTSTAFEVISGLFHSRMVLVERKPGQKLEEILKNDARFQQVYADEEAVIFRLP
ncbi:hypothetical protein K8R04_03960 [Candidatus Uhrbacteria bacterium]|nr:hypothetical protein [Candidatus Uhrbacteria bacterium]